MSNSTWFINSPNFVAAIILGRDGKVIAAETEVVFMKRWNASEVDQYCNEKGWFITNA